MCCLDCHLSRSLIASDPSGKIPEARFTFLQSDTQECDCLLVLCRDQNCGIANVTWWLSNSLTAVILFDFISRHETPVLSNPIKLIHVDEDLVVLDKPCSLPVSTLECFRFPVSDFSDTHGTVQISTGLRLDCDHVGGF